MGLTEIASRNGFGIVAGAVLLAFASPVHAASSAAATIYPSSSTSEAVWHLQAGLNVASLSCKGQYQIAGAYKQLVSRHAALIAAALRGAQRRYGLAGFDSHQTVLYNRFANQRLPASFCTIAASVADRANALDSAGLAPAAAGLLVELESSLR